MTVFLIANQSCSARRCGSVNYFQMVRLTSKIRASGDLNPYLRAELGTTSSRDGEEPDANRPATVWFTVRLHIFSW